MYKQQRILALIPARGGSKGVKRKNIRPLAGKPLIAWSIAAAQASRYIDRCVLSSEDAEIIQVAQAYGCEVPFVRPAELAADDTPGIAPVLHLLDNLGEHYDYVLQLQPTSPLRTAADIDAIIELCLDQAADSAVSVESAEPNPYWCFRLNQQQQLQALFTPIPTRRQELPEIYALNGALYLSRWETLIREKSFINQNTLAYPMSHSHSADIDTELDFAWCEFLLQQGLTDVRK